MAEAFAGMKDGAGKTALAVAIFGKAGADLIPMLNAGADGLRSMRGEAEALGVVFTGDAAIKQAEAFNDNLTRLAEASRGFGNEVATIVLPTLGALSQEFVDAAKEGTGFAAMLGSGLKTTLETIAVLGANVVYVFKAIGSEIGGIARADGRARPRRFPGLQVHRRSHEGRGRQGPRRTGQARAAHPQPAGAGSRNRPQQARCPGLRRRQGQGRQEGAGALGRRPRLWRLQGRLQGFHRGHQARRGRCRGRRQRRSADRGRKSSAACATCSAIPPATGSPNTKSRNRPCATRCRSARSTPRSSRRRWARSTSRSPSSPRTADKFKDLERAIDGWGKNSAKALADFVTEGKASFGDLARSIINDLLQMAIYQNITGPLFKSLGGDGGFLSDIGSALGFGGGRATGGPVVPGQYYVVGENGPRCWCLACPAR